MLKLIFMILPGVIIGLTPLLVVQYLLNFQPLQVYIINHCKKYTLIIGDKSICYSIYHPNIISLIRTIFCISAAAIYIISHSIVAIYIFVLFAGFDAVDGVVARICKLTTKFGEEFDPLCDKCCYIIPIICLSYKIFWGYAFAFTEFVGQFIVRKYLAKHNKSLAANNFGKIKAVLAFGTVPYLFLLDIRMPLPNLIAPLLIICIILSILSSIFKFIPNRFYANILSFINLFCGAIGCWLAFKKLFIFNIIAIMAGQFCDLFDGRMARKHGGTKYGPILDDLADFLSFGVDPAEVIIISNYGTSTFYILGFVYSLSIAFRLIRFLLIDKTRNSAKGISIPVIAHILNFLEKSPPSNLLLKLCHKLFYPLLIDKEKLPTSTFAGLPSPGAAAIILGATLLSKGWPLKIIIIATIVLTISRWHFPHLGQVILQKIPKPLQIISAALICVIAAYNMKHPSSLLLPFILFIGGISYIIIARSIKVNEI